MVPLAKDVARDYVNKFTMGSAAFSAIPIPGTSLALSAAEAAMITGIAEIYGLKTEGAVWSVIFQTTLSVIGVSTVLKAGAEFLNFIPILGWAAKPVVSGSVVKGVGEATIAYFESKFPGQKAHEKPSLNQLVAAFGEGALTGGLSEYRLGRYLQSYSTARKLRGFSRPRLLMKK